MTSTLTNALEEAGIPAIGVTAIRFGLDDLLGESQDVA